MVVWVNPSLFMDNNQQVGCSFARKTKFQYFFTSTAGGKSHWFKMFSVRQGVIIKETE